MLRRDWTIRFIIASKNPQLQNLMTLNMNSLMIQLQVLDIILLNRQSNQLMLSLQPKHLGLLLKTRCFLGLVTTILPQYRSHNRLNFLRIKDFDKSPQ